MELSLSSLAHDKMSDLDPNASPLLHLAELYHQDMRRVNEIIIERMQSNVPLIPELAGHLIAAGGKRIRPLLTLAAAGLFGADHHRQYKLAAAVEFIHTATLLHDDVVDDSDLRRGRPSANALFGNEASVLVGDFLFSRAFQLMVEDGSLDVLRILSNASAVIAEGEVLQLATTQNIDASFDDYIDVITSKTAVLFSAAAEVGAIVAGTSHAAREMIVAYSSALGISFQMADDCLDYQARSSEMGKNAGDDFKEGKMTLPLVLAIAKSNADEKIFWQRTISRLEQEVDDFDKAYHIMQKYDVFRTAEAHALSYAQKAEAQMASLAEQAQDQKTYRLLKALPSFVVKRRH